jgi:hypothetical protein
MGLMYSLARGVFVAFLVVFIILGVSVPDPDLDPDWVLIQWDLWRRIKEKMPNFWS